MHFLGLITKLIPLLGLPQAGALAENLFHFLVYKAGYKPEESAFELCRHNPAVLKILQDHPHNQQVADFTIRTLAHGTLYTVSSRGPSDMGIVDAIALKQVKGCAVPRWALMFLALQHEVPGSERQFALSSWGERVH